MSLKLYSIQDSPQTNHYHHYHHATIVFFADALNCYMFTFYAGTENEAAPEVSVNQDSPEHEFTEDTNTFEMQNISNQEKIVTLFLYFLFAWQNKFCILDIAIACILNIIKYLVYFP